MAVERNAFQVILPPVVIIGLVGLTGAEGIAIAQGRIPSSLVLLLPFGLGALGILILSLTRLGSGVALLPFVAGAVPLSIGTGTQSPLVAALLFTILLLAIWVIQGALTRRFVIAKSPVNAAAAALMVVWTLAYLASDVDRSPFVWLWDGFLRARLGQLGILLASAGILVLALNVGRELRWIKLGTWCFIGLGIPALVAFYAGRENSIWFMSTGGLFTMWGVALAYGQALFNAELPRWLRGSLLLLVVVWLIKAVLLQTISFSGWIPAVVAVSVITLAKSRRLFVVVAIIVAIAVAFNSSLVYHALYAVKVDQGDLSRLPIWEQAWQLVQQHPVLGTGPAGYAAYYITVFAGSAYSMSTHSNYLDFVAETRLVGSAVALWFFSSLLVVGWKARRTWQSGFAGGYAQAAFGGLFGVLVAMALGDWFIPFVYNQTIAGFRYTVLSWVFLGFLAGLATLRPKMEQK